MAKPAKPTESSPPVPSTIVLLPDFPPSAYSVYLTETLFPKFLHAFVPLSLHPNYLTFANLFTCLLIYVLSWVARGEEVSAPLNALILRFVCSFLVFLSLLLDCLDGMQARRTKQCSKYGEYLDHSLDAMNCLLFGTSMLVVLEPDSLTVSVSLLGSAMIYNAQNILNRYAHRMIDPPVNGMEAQTLLLTSLGAFAYLFYRIPRDYPVCPWVVIIFAFVGNLGQLSNTIFFFKLLAKVGIARAPELEKQQISGDSSSMNSFSASSEFRPFPVESALYSHFRYAFTHFLYCFLFFYYSIPRSLFYVFFTALSYRLNGRYVLYTILYQKCRLPLEKKRELYRISEFSWDYEALSWFFVFVGASEYFSVSGPFYFLLVGIFSLRMIYLNIEEAKQYKIVLSSNDEE